MKDIVWALVMSSTQVRILRGISRENPHGEPELVLSTEHKDLRDIMSDKPGRSFSSVGPGRSAMEYASDPVKDAMKAFAEQAVSLLEQHFRKHEFTRLAVVAGPQMLGILRDSLTPDLEQALIAEIPKNLLHESENDLRQLVTDHLFPK